MSLYYLYLYLIFLVLHIYIYIYKRFQQNGIVGYNRGQGVSAPNHKEINILIYK